MPTEECKVYQYYTENKDDKIIFNTILTIYYVKNNQILHSSVKRQIIFNPDGKGYEIFKDILAKYPTMEEFKNMKNKIEKERKHVKRNKRNISSINAEKNRKKLVNFFNNHKEKRQLTTFKPEVNV